MSSGSYFVLLRRSKSIENEKVTDEYIKNFIDEYNKRNCCLGNETFDNQEFYKYPLSFDYDFEKTDHFKWVSFKDHQIYDEIFICRFLSDFTQLREEFNLDSYKRSELIIDNVLAMKLKMAVDYLLSRNFSLKTEDILNNRYIRILGEILPSYESFLSNKKFTNFNDYFEKNGHTVLKKLQYLLDSYIWIDNDRDEEQCEYFLIYHVW